MKCFKCHNEIPSDMSFCPHCIEITKKELMGKQICVKSDEKVVEHSSKKGNNALPIALFGLLVWILVSYFVINNFGNKKIYFEDGKVLNRRSFETNNNFEEDDRVGISKSGFDGVRTGSDTTSIIYDNQYLKQMVVSSRMDVSNLISLDSNKQKINCSSEIIEIENEIIKNYGILAVNLCEMDLDFAKELRDVSKYIYNNYPGDRGYMTNLTLANIPETESYMAAFMPMFTFATSNTSSGYPVGLKTQIILNAKYFLNKQKINNSVRYGANSGYFPKNATRSSAVAHEFGHYLSYVAMLNSYEQEDMTFINSAKSDSMYLVYNDFNTGSFSNKIIREAYNIYLNEYNGNMDYNSFRASISSYAMSKNSSGSYIYDETVAEAFHDCYLNGNSAALASRLIIQVLNRYL